MAPATLIYLHGFASSPLSHKSRQLKAYLADSSIEYIAPALAVSPAAAIASVEKLIVERQGENVALVGSSLGGYYALYLAQTYALRAALVNPAVYPYRLLSDYLGENKNYHTGEVFFLDRSHMEELQALETGPIQHPSRLMLFQQTSDETLGYHDAEARLRFCPAWIEGGGSHGFDRFERAIPALLSFCFPD